MRLGTLASAAIVLAAAGCASVNSTPDAPQILPQENQQAAQQHPQILAEFGGELSGPVSTYVKTIGDRTAAAAGVPGQCNFSVVNTDVINAFAVPGCYIYVTRGLLAIMNSEDELASVLGHEVGHVVADHSDRRQNNQMLSGLGAVLVGVLTGSGELAQAAGQIAQVYSLGYSRDQEFESDDLGIRYLAANGYNPFAAADMLNSLGLASSLEAKTKGKEDAEQIPNWARTHPLTADRVNRAAGNATATGIAPATPEKTAPFLTAINGLIYGDDPEQGFVLGQTFAHPGLKLAFDAPEGFVITNTPQAVLIQGPNGQRAMFAGGKLDANGGIEGYARNVLQQLLGDTPAQVGKFQMATVHGFETALLPARVQTQNGQQVDIAVTAYRFQVDSAFHFVTLAPAGGGQAMAPLLRSFRKISDKEAAALKPRRVELVQVGPRDTVQTLANRMAFDDFKLERFLTLNSLPADRALTPSATVKIVTFAK